MDVLNGIWNYLGDHPFLLGAVIFALVVIVASLARKALWGLLLLALPIYVLLWTLWPGYWLIHIVFWPLFLVGVLLWLGVHKIIGKVFVALALVAALVVSFLSLNNDDPFLGLVDCKPYHYALDDETQLINNPNKEVPFAVGTPVTARDEKGIKSELQERRECGADGKADFTLLAHHYAEWSYQGFIKENPLSFTDVDGFAAQMVADGDLYRTTLATVKELENTSVFSVSEEKSIPAGLWSLYVVPDGAGGVITHQGSTSHNGTAVVFTRDGKTIMYRLECGFQILHEGPPPTDLPWCEWGVNDELMCEKSPNAADYPHLGDPTGPGEFTGDVEIEVETTTTSESGVTDTASNELGSETGGQAGGGATQVENRDPPAAETGANDPVTGSNSGDTVVANPFG